MSPEEFYAFQQQVNQKQIDDLADFYAENPEAATRHADYLEGLKAGERASLRGR